MKIPRYSEGAGIWHVPRFQASKATSVVSVAGELSIISHT